MEQMITLPRNNTGLVGQHGSYYKLSETVGVKVLHSKAFKSVAQANRSRAFQKASREAEILVEAYETGVVPMCYGVTVVRAGEEYRVGVLMQHLGSVMLSESEFYDDQDIYNDINECLKEIGIHHADLNEDNIMVYRGKFYAIDFSPDCVMIK